MSANFEELCRTSIANPSESVLRHVLNGTGVSDEEIRRTISTSSGLVAYDLQAPAKNLYPVNTPLRNKIPRVGGGVGTATNWRQVNAITGSGYDAMGWIPEGQRSGQMSYNTSNKSATYVTLGEEDAATYEAISAGRTFEDIQARMTMRLLQKMMLKEEMAILAGNASLALGTAPTPTLSASGTGATLPALTYSVIAVALTAEGYRNSKLSAPLSVPTTQTITGADGKNFVLNGGTSNKSAAATQAVTLGQTLFCSVTAVSGAVAYGWFVGASGAEKLEAITTINSATFSAPLAGTGTAATAVAADYSANTNYAFNGLLTTAFTSGNSYIATQATGTAGTGTPLTASGRGSVVEIDTMLLTMWNNYQVSPTVLYMNAQEIKNVTTKVLQGSSNSALLMYTNDSAAGADYNLTAGGTISYYYNPFTQSGGMKIPVVIHPFVPPGTIIGWAENLPIQYQSNEVGNVAEMKTRVDYYEVAWPITTRQRQVGVYVEEVLAVYAPFAMGIITNCANG